MITFEEYYQQTLQRIHESDGIGIGAMTDSSVFNTPDVMNGADLLNGGTTYAPNDSRNPFVGKKKKRKVKKRL